MLRLVPPRLSLKALSDDWLATLPNFLFLFPSPSYILNLHFIKQK